MKALTSRLSIVAPLVFGLAGMAMTAQRNPSPAPPPGEPAAEAAPVRDLPVLGLAEKARGHYQNVPPPGAGQGGGGRAGTPRYVPADPINFNDTAGWTSMFDGKTLNGWDGPNLWRVEDGAIVVNSKADPPTGSVYLLYTASQPKDFEFKWEVKLEGSGPNSTGPNSGVQFRATRLSVLSDRPNSRWETRGYQADFDNGFSNVGALIECCSGASRDGVRPRPDRAQAGQVVRAAVADGQMPKTLATFGDSAAVANAAYKPGEWNQMHLIARGRTMMFVINGQLMSVLIDDHPTKFLPQGFLSVQLEGRGDNKASFRNLWLKNLE
jgi:hypothetical protein